MTTLLKISWRNIWRNKLRTIVILTAIALGVWSVIFITSFSGGMVSSYINNAVQNETSHLQIHQEKYLKDKEIKYYLDNTNEIVNIIKQEPEVKAVTVRSITNAMLSSSKGARGIRVKGIDPIEEAKVTGIADKVVEGEFLSNEKRNPILVSQRTADKMKLKLRKKVVLTFQNLAGEVTAASFRVVGIFDTGSAPVDEANLFIRRNDLNRLMGVENINISPSNATTVSLPKEELGKNIAHEVAIILNDVKQVDAVAASLKEKLPNLKVETYREVAPDMELYETSMAVTGLVVMTIFMFALIFGIINTMLMAVLERTKELGMLMAVGMNKAKVFWMIVIETLMLGMIAAPFGLLLGYLTVNTIGKKGLDLSSYGNGLEEFGMSTIVYPYIEPQLYWQLAIAVLITAILGSLYPAWKAVKLRPVEAIRSV